MWGVVVGLCVGKLVGIGAGSILATRLGLGTVPRGVGQGHVMGGAALSGIGFTVSLLIIGLAFDDPEIRAEATVGVLLSAVLAVGLGAVVFWLARALLRATRRQPAHGSRSPRRPRARPHPRTGRCALDAARVRRLRVPLLRRHDRCLR